MRYVDEAHLGFGVRIVLVHNDLHRSIPWQTVPWKLEDASAFSVCWSFDAGLADPRVLDWPDTEIELVYCDDDFNLRPICTPFVGGPARDEVRLPVCCHGPPSSELD